MELEVIDGRARWQTENDWAKGADARRLVGNAAATSCKDADLRGMGGAGIPATQKWRDVRDAVRTARQRARRTIARFIVVNGDESEPGTFKDRELLLRTPHVIVEGVILAGLITEATQGFIYIRHEYPEQIAGLPRGDRARGAAGLLRRECLRCSAGRFRSRCSSVPAATSAASRAR